MTYISLGLPTACIAVGVIAALSGCGDPPPPAQPLGIDPRRMADGIHAVVDSDRAIYTKKVVNRLVKEEKVIKATETWQEDKSLPLPAQMFRMGAELVAEKNPGFTYSLQSIWAINKQNLPKTDVEKEGLEAVAKDKGLKFYREEMLGGKKYLTAVYADVAIASACVDCHNDHDDSPKTDFKLNDVMGGVVIRIPIE